MCVVLQITSTEDDTEAETPPNTKKPRVVANLCHWNKTAKYVLKYTVGVHSTSTDSPLHTF